jgi:fructose-bisphosphate aldolase class II
MPLIPLLTLLEDAQERRYIACYCEAWNLESFEAVVEAAEETRSPIIAGFNGGFLCHPNRRCPENLSYYAALGQALKESPVPAVFLLNETDDFAQIHQAIELGFNAVMVDNERLEIEPYRRLVQKAVCLAHSAGVAVEAAVGRLAHARRDGNAVMTDPEAARRFAEETGIDALGVAVGNIHILTRGKAAIQLDALARIHEATDLPLVLHGGTGIPLKLAPRFLQLGVRKINFGTVLKQTYLRAVRKKLASYREPMNPHPFLGMGGPEDALVAGREAVKRQVIALLRASGSAGKARRFPYSQEGVDDYS